MLAALPVQPEVPLHLLQDLLTQLELLLLQLAEHLFFLAGLPDYDFGFELPQAHLFDHRQFEFLQPAGA